MTFVPQGKAPSFWLNLFVPFLMLGGFLPVGRSCESHAPKKFQKINHFLPKLLLYTYLATLDKRSLKRNLVCESYLAGAVSIDLLSSITIGTSLDTWFGTCQSLLALTKQMQSHIIRSIQCLHADV